MKTKVLLSSILTIALCICLIAGSTFALFTSTSKVNITVNAGHVNMVASLNNLTLYSAKGDSAGSLVDENGKTYSYEAKVDNFTNGGTASIDATTGAVLNIQKITPGDKVSFQVQGANESNVAIQYRYIIECLEGELLMSGLEISVNEAGFSAPVVNESVHTYTSAWTSLLVGQAMNPATIEIALPISAGNEYQDEETSIKITVEAVQGNAVVDNENKPAVSFIEKANTASEAIDAITNANNTYVLIGEDLTATIDGDVANKTIDAAGNEVSLTFTGKLENVVVENITEIEGGNSINVKNATGDITVINSTLKSAGGTKAPAFLTGANVNLTIENCTITSVAGAKSYGIYNSGDNGGVTVINSTFEGLGSWAIMLNNAVNGDLVVEGCTFNNLKGVIKVLSGVNGDATIVNNVMTNCVGHDNVATALLCSTSKNTALTCTGTLTCTGNTLNGAAWTL